MLKLFIGSSFMCTFKNMQNQKTADVMISMMFASSELTSKI